MNAANETNKDKVQLEQTAVTEDDIVKYIVQHIIENNLKENERLPSIQTLARHFDTNPSIVRSGYLRAETLGIITIHSRAGAFVKRFDFDQLSHMFALLFELGISQLSPRILQVYDARLIIEKEIFRIAADRATPEDLHYLNESIKKLQNSDDRVSFVKADEEFHLQVAQISGNNILVIMLKSILTLLRAHRISLRITTTTPEQVVEDHIALYKAISQKDPDRAADIAAHHNDRRKTEILKDIMSKQG